MQDRMKGLLILLSLLLGASLSLWAQTGRTITGVVVDDQGGVAPYCNVVALRADSTVCGATVTDLEGRFVLALSKDTRWVGFRYVGYKDVLFTLEELPERVVLTPEQIELDDVVVRAERPRVEMKHGVLEMGVQGTSLVHKPSVYKVIGALPGVQLKKESELSLLGGGKYLIYIDGRQVQDEAELATMDVKNLRSVSIDPTPGVRYGSEVKAVIKIRTLTPLPGLGVTLSSRVRRGYLWRTDHNLKLGYSRGMAYYYTALLYDYNALKMEKSVETDFLRSEGTSLAERLETTSWQRDSSQTGRLTLGVDFTPMDNLVFGVRYDGYMHQMNGTTQERSLAHRGETLHDDVTSHGRMTKRPYSHHVAVYGDLSFAKRWTVSLASDYYTKRLEDTQEANERSDVYNTTRLYPTRNQSDYDLLQVTPVLSYTFANQSRWELGGEVASIRGKGDQVEGQTEMKTTDYTNSETSYALFLSTSFPIGSWYGKLGVRYEYLRSELFDKLSPAGSLLRNYSDPFYSASLSGKIGETNHSLQLASSTRRPSLQQMNGYTYHSSSYLIQQGNPLLIPQKDVTLSYTLTWLLLYWQTAYTYSRDLIASDFRVNPDLTNAYIISYTNFKSGYNFQTVVGADYELGFYTLGLQGGFGLQKVDTRREKGYVRQLPLYMGKITHTFNLPWAVSAEIEYQYISPSTAQLYEITETHDLSFYLSKSFWDEKLSLSLYVNDILESDGNDIRTTLNGLRLHLEDIVPDTRYVSLRLRWNFQSLKRERSKNAAAQNINRL